MMETTEREQPHKQAATWTDIRSNMTVKVVVVPKVSGSRKMDDAASIPTKRDAGARRAFQQTKGFDFENAKQSGLLSWMLLACVRCLDVGELAGGRTEQGGRDRQGSQHGRQEAWRKSRKTAQDCGHSGAKEYMVRKTQSERDGVQGPTGSSDEEERCGVQRPHAVPLKWHIHWHPP